MPAAYVLETEEECTVFVLTVIDRTANGKDCVFIQELKLAINCFPDV
jgi:hypothetical protein